MNFGVKPYQFEPDESVAECSKIQVSDDKRHSTDSTSSNQSAKRHSTDSTSSNQSTKTSTNSKSQRLKNTEW